MDTSDLSRQQRLLMTRRHFFGRADRVRSVITLYMCASGARLLYEPPLARETILLKIDDGLDAHFIKMLHSLAGRLRAPV